MAKKKAVSGTYILDDSKFERIPTTGVIKDDVLRGKTLEWPGRAICACPFEGRTAIDYTGQPGATTGLYYSLAFQLGKWEYIVAKADEWIEVSPVHAQYYQLTQQQKSDLEAKIKTGLTSVSQSVADMELLMHDMRKYKEFLHYFGYHTKRQINDMSKKKNVKDIPYDYDEIFLDDKDAGKRADNHSLRAVFIDQVDAHTGEAMALRSIVQRWPTLISDFMRMDDKDMDVEALRKKLDVSRAEAVVLVTKNKLFTEWKNLFSPEVVSRYRRIHDLVRSREESVNQYREWLKPIVARHRMISEGLSSPDRRASMLTSFIPSAGTATSSARITLWTWKDFRPSEIYKGGYDEMTRLMAEKKLTPYDNWTKNTLIFGREFGLINKYNWLTDDWVNKQMDSFFNRGWLSRNAPYYSFFIINFDRTNIRMPTGSETEDGVFDVNLIVMSQNVLFTKLLELAAKQEELNAYIDRLLGLPPPNYGKRGDLENRDVLSNANKFLSKNVFFGMKFWKSGPYEKDFFDRLTNIYYAALVGVRYQQIVKFMKNKIGMPT